MHIFRVLVATCVAAMGVAMLCVALLSAYDAALVLLSYDEVEGVVTGVNGDEVRVDYVRPDGRKAVLRAGRGGKFSARPVGKKLAVLLPPRDRTDNAAQPILKSDLNRVAAEFMVALFLLGGAAAIWWGKSRRVSSQSVEGIRTRSFDTRPKNPERQAQLQASIDLEIAERRAKKDAR
ncbi:MULTISPECIES: DUF3592 domain-containing protein [unclassified Variovorax]|uniref:DUF3592 domain-containing protein n=1 Tax=unclassified Variovorax TaxID=663243 RepID=UPI0032E5A803